MPWNTPLERRRAGRRATARAAPPMRNAESTTLAEHRAERVEPAHERDDDRGEPVAARDVRRELSHRARRPRTRRRSRRARPRRGASSRPPRATRTRRSAPPPARGRRSGAGCRGSVRNMNSHMTTAATSANANPQCSRMPRTNARDLGRRRELHRLREVEAARVLPRPEDEPGEEEVRDVDEHQADEDLVRVEAVAEEAPRSRPTPRRPRPPRPRASGKKAHGESARRGVRDPQREPAARDRAHQELPLGADVPHVRAEAEPEAERAQDERRAT